MEDRIWCQRPDGIDIKMPTKNKIERITYLRVQDNVRCHGLVHHTIETNIRGAIHIHKISTGQDDVPLRMPRVGQISECHFRNMLAK